MSLTDVRPYFRARLQNLSLVEWTDAFNFENIPNVKLNNIFHIDTTDFTNVRYSHANLELDIPVIIRTFKKGFRRLSEGYDDAIEKAESILKECCKIGNAKTQTNIKDVKFSSISIDPIADSNDNIFQITNSFVVNLVLDIDS